MMVKDTTAPLLLLRATVQSSPRSRVLQDRLDELTPSQALHWTLMGSHGLSAVLNAGAMAVLAPVVTRNAMNQLVVDNLKAWFAGKPPLTPIPETPVKGR